METEQNCNILTPTLITVSVGSFSRAAQPEGQRPSSQLDDGFLYCILSQTGLQNSIGGPEGPFGRVWLSLPHLVSNSVRSLTVWLLVLTELYISSTPTQSPTQSLEWHVWLSSSGNNCHAVQRSLSSGVSVYECIMGFLPCPISSAKSAHAISFDYWPLECVTSFRCITLEWHVWPGRRSKYNSCSSFMECVYFRLLNPSLIFDMFIVVCVCVLALEWFWVSLTAFFCVCKCVLCGVLRF